MCPLALDETDPAPILTKGWYVKYALINLVAWLLLFALLIVIAYYT